MKRFSTVTVVLAVSVTACGRAGSTELGQASVPACRPGTLCVPTGLDDHVETGTARIADEKLRYAVREAGTPDALQDCSGIFHRVLQGSSAYYPDYPFPQPSKRRSTRALALWYLGNAQLTVIAGDQKALAKDNLIEVGAVMFYGRAAPYAASRAAYDGLTSARIKSTGGEETIDHMGVVTDVIRDPKTLEVLDYTLFHGHGPPQSGKPGDYASVTYLQKRHPERSFQSCEGSSQTLPSGKKKTKCAPLGYWNQPWVAVAPAVDAATWGAVGRR
ncbi:MAG: hypothetical protein E4H03_07030 [Myxococcales bacterium]|nr:MAG: hypothetical protein E4H03_07030 [Myxococcales bacterium]